MSRVSFQVAAILLFIVTIFFLWDFSQRVITNVRLAQIEKTYEQAVAQEEQRNRDLRERKQFVQTDGYADWYARHYWHWASPNDIVVIPQIPPTPTPNRNTPTPAPVPTKTWQQELFDFLFGP